MKRSILLTVRVDSEMELDEICDTLLKEYSRSPFEGSVNKVETEDVVGDLPQVVSQFLVYNLGEDAFAVDFEQVADLMDYIAEKPLLVCKTLFKLQAALNGLYSAHYDLFNQIKEDLEKYEAERYAYYADYDNGLKFKRTRESINSFVQAEQTWIAKSRRLKDAQRVKSNLYTAKEQVSQAYDLARDFVRNGRDVYVGDNPKDRSFKELVDGLTKSEVDAAVEGYSHGE